jgi:hypothetical protein
MMNAENATNAKATAHFIEKRMTLRLCVSASKRSLLFMVPGEPKALD